MQQNATELGITGFEYYMLADDSPKYPMIFWLKATFKGKVDESTFKTALTKTLAEHPLSTALLHGNPNGVITTLCWKIKPRESVFYDIRNLNEPIDKFYIDLKKEPGTRIFIREDNEQSIWYLQFHHSTADGTGALRFFEILLTHYGQHSHSQSPSSETLTRFRTRGMFHHSKQWFFSRFAKDLHTGWKYYIFTPYPLKKRKKLIHSPLISGPHSVTL